MVSKRIKRGERIFCFKYPVIEDYMGALKSQIEQIVEKMELGLEVRIEKWDSKLGEMVYGNLCVTQADDICFSGIVFFGLIKNKEVVELECMPFCISSQDGMHLPLWCLYGTMKGKRKPGVALKKNTPYFLNKNTVYLLEGLLPYKGEKMRGGDFMRFLNVTSLGNASKTI